MKNQDYRNGFHMGWKHGLGRVAPVASAPRECSNEFSGTWLEGYGKGYKLACECQSMHEDREFEELR